MSANDSEPEDAGSAQPEQVKASLLDEILESTFARLGDAEHFGEPLLAQLRKLAGAGGLTRPPDVTKALRPPAEEADDEAT